MTLAWCGLHRIHLSEFLLQGIMHGKRMNGTFFMAADMVQLRALSP